MREGHLKRLPGYLHALIDTDCRAQLVGKPLKASKAANEKKALLLLRYLHALD
jgi:hypothetical protein